MIQEDPELVRPFDDYIGKLMRSGLIAETLAMLGPHIPALLMSRDVSDGLRDKLISSLSKLDWLDAMASYLGIKVPFGVESMIAPAVETRVDPYAKTRLVLKLSQRKAFPRQDESPVVVWYKSDFGGEGGAEITRDISVLKPDLKGYRPTTSFNFFDSAPAGPNGRCFRFYVTNLSRQTYMKLRPPGLRAGLPIRLPDTWPANATSDVVLSVTLRGGLGSRMGTWRVDHDRCVSHGPRPFFSVDAIVAESLP